MIYNIDCLKGLESLEDNTIDMVFTSPPYAQQRKDTYGGIDSTEYVSWFLPIAREISRVLKPTGSFFLNIKEHTVKKTKYKSTYVKELVYRLCTETDLNEVDTLVWTKNGFPGKPYTRFKNGWEPIYHFAKYHRIKMHPERVMVPLKEATYRRIKNKYSGASNNNSGMIQPRFENFKGKTKAYPSNVIHVDNIINAYSPNKWHPATFPKKLVEFFIMTYTDEGDLVLDPFAGSGTVGVVCKETNRDFIGYELNKDYCEKIKETIGLEVDI